MLPQFDMNTKKDIHQLMEDVRKAHRIIYQFQDRMLQLMNRIANDYGLNHPVGRKRFSNPIGSTRRGNDYPEANLRVHDKWVWDMLYTYEFEYYFGKISRNNLNGCLTVFQISDNGYYLADGHRLEEGESGHLSKRAVNDFWSTDQSDSYLIFVFESFPQQGHRIFLKHPKNSIVRLYGGNDDVIIEHNGENTIVAKRFSIEDFFSRGSVGELLEEFSNLVFSNTTFRLLDK
jgi:hypothetical protein